MRCNLVCYYGHFEIAEFSWHQYLFDLASSWFDEKGKQKAFSSHIVHETEMMQYRANIARNYAI